MFPGMRRLLLLLVPLFAVGCFAFDEIDKGQKEMDRYGGRSKGKAEEEAAKSDELSPKERARQWWDKARTLTPREEDAPGDIVSCKVGGAIRFTTETDCRNVGGRVERS
jgi:hypothetical protein